MHPFLERLRLAVRPAPNDGPMIGDATDDDAADRWRPYRGAGPISFNRRRKPG